jgi:hypothetical protein
LKAVNLGYALITKLFINEISPVTHMPVCNNHCNNLPLRLREKETFMKFTVFLKIYLFWWDCGLNSGLHALKAGVLALEHASSPFCSGYFGDGVL